MEKNLIESMGEKYEEFLIDESKYRGYADSISFPESEEQVCQILRQMKERKIPVTIQGGKTGIVGGAVPHGGHILNLSRMNRVLDWEKCSTGEIYITVEPGIPLMDLKKEVLRLFGKEKVFWPVQPTEESATVGGVAATSAQGPNGYWYGKSSQYIAKVRMACAGGEIVEFDREKDAQKLESLLGLEGLAGVFTALTLRLVKKPEDVWGICFFFEKEEELADFSDALNGRKWENQEAHLSLKEYLDRDTIKMIQRRKQDMAKIRELPDVDEDFDGMIYLELEGSSDCMEELAADLMELAAEHGSDPDVAWALSGEAEVEKLRAFRHAAAESANLRVEANRKETPEITKLSTDFIWEGREFSKLLKFYRQELAQTSIESAVFGHLESGHLHVNLFPQTEQEYQKACELLRTWAQNCVSGRGKAVGEHGVGKLKKTILRGLYPERENLCRELKRLYDPEFLMNREDVLDREE